MINRTYVVLMPSTGFAGGPLDIVVEGPVGTKSAPVSSAVGGTAPPVGWNGNDGAYYEWRGRPLRIEKRAAVLAAGGFVPRFRLGWHLSIYGVGATLEANVPGIQFSQSLVENLDGGAIINAPNLADPSYGPVVRLLGSVDVASRFYVVHLGVMEPKDEDRSPTGL